VACRRAAWAARMQDIRSAFLQNNPKAVSATPQSASLHRHQHEIAAYNIVGNAGVTCQFESQSTTAESAWPTSMTRTQTQSNAYRMAQAVNVTMYGSVKPSAVV
jgi:hypothetical protein